MPNETSYLSPNITPNVTMVEAEKAKVLVKQALQRAKYEVGGLTVVCDPLNPSDGTVHDDRGMIVAEIYILDTMGYWGLANMRNVIRQLRDESPSTPIPFVKFDIKQALTPEC